MVQMEDERKEHEAKLKRMETEMEQVFDLKVREKKQKLKESETDVRVWSHIKANVTRHNHKIIRE